MAVANEVLPFLVSTGSYCAFFLLKPTYKNILPYMEVPIIELACVQLEFNGYFL